VLCQVRPLGKSAKADGQPRALAPAGPDLSPLPPTGIAPLLKQLLLGSNLKLGTDQSIPR
jgi:putative transposase